MDGMKGLDAGEPPEDGRGKACGAGEAGVGGGIDDGRDLDDGSVDKALCGLSGPRKGMGRPGEPGEVGVGKDGAEHGVEDGLRMEGAASGDAQPGAGKHKQGLFGVVGQMGGPMDEADVRLVRNLAERREDGVTAPGGGRQTDVEERRGDGVAVAAVGRRRGKRGSGGEMQEGRTAAVRTARPVRKDGRSGAVGSGKEGEGCRGVPVGRVAGEQETDEPVAVGQDDADARAQVPWMEGVDARAGTDAGGQVGLLQARVRGHVVGQAEEGSAVRNVQVGPVEVVGRDPGKRQGGCGTAGQEAEPTGVERGGAVGMRFGGEGSADHGAPEEVGEVRVRASVGIAGAVGADGMVELGEGDRASGVDGVSGEGIEDLVEGKRAGHGHRISGRMRVWRRGRAVDAARQAG
jgi:hypothetical protein